MFKHPLYDREHNRFVDSNNILNIDDIIHTDYNSLNQRELYTKLKHIIGEDNFLIFFIYESDELGIDLYIPEVGYCTGTDSDSWCVTQMHEIKQKVGIHRGYMIKFKTPEYLLLAKIVLF